MSITTEGLTPKPADAKTQELRLSLQVWGQPRFVLTIDKEAFLSLKQLISFLCTKMGLVSDSETAEKQIETYLLMLEDAIVLNINSVRDNDRLTLVTVQQLASYLKSKLTQATAEEKKPTQMAFLHDEKSTQEDPGDDLDLVVEVDGNDANPEETKKQYDEQLQKMIELE